jgi:hypothetical protein
MMIIGVDYHPSFQQIAFLDQETGEGGEQRLSHDGGEADRSIESCSSEESACVLGWKRPDLRVGSSDCWQNSVSSYGLAIQRKSRPGESKSRKPTARTQNSC